MARLILRPALSFAIMKSIFNHSDRATLIQRVMRLKSGDQCQWGKMNLYQMLKHCTLSEEMFQGKKYYTRLFIGRLFGKMAAKQILKDTTPLKRNQPTHPSLRITGNGDITAEKERWIALLEAYSSFNNNEFTHPFFGKMNKEQVGFYVYKHTDHHLRQFGA